VELVLPLTGFVLSFRCHVVLVSSLTGVDAIFYWCLDLYCLDMPCGIGVVIDKYCFVCLLRHFRCCNFHTVWKVWYCTVLLSIQFVLFDMPCRIGIVMDCNVVAADGYWLSAKICFNLLVAHGFGIPCTSASLGEERREMRVAVKVKVQTVLENFLIFNFQFHIALLPILLLTCCCRIVNSVLNRFGGWLSNALIWIVNGQQLPPLY
jgi:hypothetical protein